LRCAGRVVRRLEVLAAMIGTALIACSARHPEPGSPLEAGATGRSTESRILPDLAAPFAASAPIQAGQGFVRRSYSLADKRVEITVARVGRGSTGYESWIAGSRDYPQVLLPVPPEQANGFFSCGQASGESACDFHLQFRSGFHVEGMGNGRVPRSDLIKLLAHLPLAELTDPAALPI